MQRAIEKYRNGEITKEEYDQWRYNYPKYDTYSRRAKVPSQEISDLFTKLNPIDAKNPLPRFLSARDCFLIWIPFKHLRESFFTPKPLGTQNDGPSGLRYQIVIRRDFQIQKTQCFQGFQDFSRLFEFNSSRWLRCNIIHYSIHTTNFIDDSIHSLI